MVIYYLFIYIWFGNDIQILSNQGFLHKTYVKLQIVLFM